MGYALVSEVLHFGHENRPSSSAKAEDVVAVLIEDTASVSELPNCAPLVTGDGYGVCILLNGGMGELIGPAVVSEVDDLASLAL